MGKVLGEVKVTNFLENTLKQFPYEETTREHFMYKFALNDCACAIGYEKKSKLLSRTYHFTVIIEKDVKNEVSTQREAQYCFQSKRWKSKKDNVLVHLANKQFALDWARLDIESLKIIESENKRTFKMLVLPGSYTTLIFPPMTQGIALYPEEIKTIEGMIDTMTQILDTN